MLPGILFLLMQPDPAMAPAKVTVNPGEEYAAVARPWQGIPTIERTRKGRLWAAWYAGGRGEGPSNWVIAASSDDDGKTWSRPRVAVDPEWHVRAFDPCLWTDPTGRLWLFYAQAAGLWDGRGGVWAISTGDPDAKQPKWSAPRRLANGVMLNKPTVTRNGRWLFPIAGWRNIDPVSRLARQKVDWSPHAMESLIHDIGEEKDSNVFVSTDKLKTVRLAGRVQVPGAQHDEHMIVERNNGELWMLVRTRYGIGQAISNDHGATWGGKGESDIPHVVSRFFIRRLRSGNLLLVKHAPPDGKTRSHLTAWISQDDGKSWTGGLMVDDRVGVSYPDAVESPDGRMYIIYDRERSRAKEILMAVIREADITAGRTVSSDARLRVLVDRATGQ
ncbi:MAG: exo-alpha-sialidase [Bryobacterales bacterium]|nr:exo-alpha-sialidase [Bryobacterales bacterium]